MRKQSRRLWFGEWQRGQEPGDPADTFQILTDDETEPAQNRPARQRRAAGLAALAAVVALAVAVLSGSNDTRLTFTPPQVPPAQFPQQTPVPQPQAPQNAPPGGFGGADLTGATAAKAARAALHQVPGSIERVTAGPSGGYVVHVFTPDGYEVHVVISNQFKVLGSDGGNSPPAGGAPRGSGNSS